MLGVVDGGCVIYQASGNFHSFDGMGCTLIIKIPLFRCEELKLEFVLNF